MSEDKMMREYQKYAIMKKERNSPREICLAAKTDGLDSVERFKVLMYICDLSLEEAKEVIVCVDTGAKSLNEYQEKYILPALKEAFETERKEQGSTQEKTESS